MEESLSNMCEVLGSVLSTGRGLGARKPERSEGVFSGRAHVCYEQGLRLPTLSSINELIEVIRSEEWVLP